MTGGNFCTYTGTPPYVEATKTASIGEWAADGNVMICSKKATNIDDPSDPVGGP